MKVPPPPDSPSVRQAGLPSVRVGVDTAGTYGEEVGQALQKAGGMVSQYAAQAKAFADESATAKAMATMQERATSDVTQFLQNKGENAHAASDGFYSGLEKARTELRDKLQGRQREDFDLRSRGLMLDIRRRAETHVASEGLAAATSNATALAKSAVESADVLYPDPKGLEDRLQEAEVHLRNTGSRLGRSLEEINLTVKDMRAQADDRVLRHLTTDGRFDDAEAYLKRPEVRERLGDRALRHEKDVKDSKMDREARGWSAHVVAASRMPETGWVDSGALHRYLQEVPADVRASAEKYAEIEAANSKETRAADTGARYDAAHASYLQTGSRGSASLNAVPPPLKNWLERNAPTEWQKLKNIADGDDREARARAEGRETKPTPVQERAYAQAAWEMVSTKRAEYLSPNMTPERFAQRWESLLTKKQYGRLYGEWVSAIRTLNRPDQTPGISNDVQEQLLTKGRGMEVFPKGDPSTWQKDADVTRFNRAREELREKAEDWRMTHGGELPPLGETKKWVDQQLAHQKMRKTEGGVTERDWYTREVPAINVPEERAKGRVLVDEEGNPLPGEVPAAAGQPAPAAPPGAAPSSTHVELEPPKKAERIEDVPEDHVRNITEAMAKGGKKATDADVILRYNRMLGR